MPGDMSDTHTHEDQQGLEDLTPEEANRIIHSHRKVRYGTACWPCRQRKVKCDNKSPCENCVKREHAQMCSYRPNRSSHGAKPSVTNAGTDGVNGHVGLKREHSPDRESSHPAYRRQLSQEETPEAIRAYEPDPVETSRYLGQNSIPALLREQGQAGSSNPASPRHGGTDTIRQDMRSIFGLDNSAPFPLMSQRHLSKLTQDISSELPSDREVMKLFRSYKEIPQPFWGFVIDISDLESKLMVYLEDRAKNAKASIRAPKPVSASWLAVLFAVLAVGSQYHDSPYHIRTKDSQRYIQISVHFLRVGNFLLRPNFDSVQALLMVSFVLLNDMKAEASWALLGLTCRLAQSLGLHLNQEALPTIEGREHVPDLSRKEWVRRKLWWTCVWHDTLISLSFDRSPMTNIACCPIPLSPSADAHGWAYIEAMYHLCDIICRKLNPEALANTNYKRIMATCTEVESVREQLVPSLRKKEDCRSAIDRLQHFAIRLHTSFVVSVCCRPALRRSPPTNASSITDAPSPTTTNLTADEKLELSNKCKSNLTETVRMFLSMHQLSVIPTRSWAFTYHGLSSAVLLGILGETKADPEVRQLQGDLIAALSATAAKEEAQTTSPQPHIQQTDRDIELSGPLSRALLALKNIYDHGGVMAPGQGHMKESARSGGSAHAFSSLPGSGARTPLPGAVGMGLGPLPPINGSGVNGNGNGATDASLNQQQQQLHSAALAMADMAQQQQQQQQGLPQMEDYRGIPYASSLPPPPPSMPGPPTVPDLNTSIGGGPPTTTGLQVGDPSTYTGMSPMDLYDSIFWEVPDPYQGGLDAMNFDFLAQPPPGQQQQQQYYF